MHRTKTILLVEDNEDDLFFMKRALQRADISNPLQVALNGQEVIDYLAGTEKFSDRAQFPLPFLILLDLKLPVKNGHEVLHWIRQQPALKNVIVIFLTTSKESSDIEKAYQLGTNAYLVKPSGAPQLIEMMTALKQFWLVHNQF